VLLFVVKKLVVSSLRAGWGIVIAPIVTWVIYCQGEPLAKETLLEKWAEDCSGQKS